MGYIRWGASTIMEGTMSIVNTDKSKASEWVLVHKDGEYYVCQENHYQQTSCEDTVYTIETYSNMTEIESRVSVLGLTNRFPEDEE
jgi:hypothetical protein